jgi:hypothetical protein
VTDQDGLSDFQSVSITVTEPTGDVIVSFTLINADTNQNTRPLINGDILTLQDLPTVNIAIRANTTPAVVGSVRFSFNSSTNFRTEGSAPYALFGDTNGNYASWNGLPLSGAHTLSATPFSGSGGSGTPGTALTISFTVEDDGSGIGDTFSWETRTPASIPRYEAQGIAANGMLYVFGGFFTSHAATAQSDAYDPNTDTWLPISDTPELLTHSGQAVDGATVYFAGGFIGNHPGGSTNHVWAYNTISDTWTAGTNLPVGRGGGSLVKYGRELHYFGGAERTAGINVLTDFGSHWVLGLGLTDSPHDDATSWTVAASMPNPRNHLGGATVAGKIYAIGGQHAGNEHTGNQSDVHAYDPQTDTWNAVASMPKPLGHITSSIIVRNGHIIVAGGVTQGTTKVADVIDYNPISDTWVSLQALPSRRQSPVVGLIGNQIIVSGGSLGGPQNNLAGGFPEPGVRIHHLGGCPRIEAVARGSGFEAIFSIK